MAATRLIALHVNKGKTVAQCLADRTDYSQNAAKTNDGEFISSYECDPKTADEEFLLSKRQYQHITGRQLLSRPQKNEWLRFRRCSSTSKIIATQDKSISNTASLDIAKSSLRNTVRKLQFIKRRSKPLTNCKLQSSHLCNRYMRSFISWQSRKSRTTLSTVRLEKKKKNC